MKNKERIIEELKEALRWPEDIDVVSPDMDSRSSLKRAEDYVIEQTKRAREEVLDNFEKKSYEAWLCWADDGNSDTFGVVHIAESYPCKDHHHASMCRIDNVIRSWIKTIKRKELKSLEKEGR
jgi:hypothetical protein